MYNLTQKGIDYLLSLDAPRTQNAKNIIRQFGKQKKLKTAPKNDINNISVSYYDEAAEKRYWILRNDLFYWS